MRQQVVFIAYNVYTSRFDKRALLMSYYTITLSSVACGVSTREDGQLHYQKGVPGLKFGREGVFYFEPTRHNVTLCRLKNLKPKSKSKTLKSK